MEQRSIGERFEDLQAKHEKLAQELAVMQQKVSDQIDMVETKKNEMTNSVSAVEKSMERAVTWFRWVTGLLLVAVFGVMAYYGGQITSIKQEGVTTKVELKAEIRESKSDMDKRFSDIDQSFISLRRSIENLQESK